MSELNFGTLEQMNESKIKIEIIFKAFAISRDIMNVNFKRICKICTRISKKKILW